MASSTHEPCDRCAGEQRRERKRDGLVEQQLALQDACHPPQCCDRITEMQEQRADDGEVELPVLRRIQVVDGDIESAYGRGQGLLGNVECGQPLRVCGSFCVAELRSWRWVV